MYVCIYIYIHIHTCIHICIHAHDMCYYVIDDDAYTGITDKWAIPNTDCALLVASASCSHS